MFQYRLNDNPIINFVLKRKIMGITDQLRPGAMRDVRLDKGKTGIVDYRLHSCTEDTASHNENLCLPLFLTDEVCKPAEIAAGHAIGFQAGNHLVGQIDQFPFHGG